MSVLVRLITAPKSQHPATLHFRNLSGFQTMVRVKLVVREGLQGGT